MTPNTKHCGHSHQPPKPPAMAERWNDLVEIGDCRLSVTDATAYGLEYGLTGMRLSHLQTREHTREEDLNLAHTLTDRGPSHRKFLRLGSVWCRITAPRYWWTQFDTYKIGVDGVSESTMHTLDKRPIRIEDFAVTRGDFDLMGHTCGNALTSVVHDLNRIREKAVKESGDRKKYYFDLMVKLLPQSYLQTRIVRISFEALRKMVEERSMHKLTEWRVFCDWVRRNDREKIITWEL